MAGRLRDQATGRGYHCTRPSKTYSGGGCARASPSGYGLDERVVPRGRPACWADPRRLGRLADVGESPLHRVASVMKATPHKSVLQRVQTSGRDSNRRASSMAHGQCAGERQIGVAPVDGSNQVQRAPGLRRRSAFLWTAAIEIREAAVSFGSLTVPRSQAAADLGVDGRFAATM
jgi:hypothetical protein